MKISQTIYKPKDTTIYYRFLLKDSSTVAFYHKKYFDFDLMQANQQSEIITLNKKFLRKNKSKILTYDFFVKNEEKEVTFFLRMLYSIINNTNKKIFIIFQIFVQTNINNK